MSVAGFLCQCDSSPLIFLNWVAHGSNESTQLQIEGLIILSLYSRPPTALCVGIPLCTMACSINIQIALN